MMHTHVILDGLQDPLLGQALSAQWAGEGFCNAVDVAGQAAWLSPGNDMDAALTEPAVNRAAAIARGYGLEIRDRVGRSFCADNDLSQLRCHMAYEYKSRFTTALVFGLPALVLHYMGPVLAGGVEGLGGVKWMMYPWLLELLLVGWVCVAAGWPILWQGAVSLRYLRGTGDLLTSLLVVAAFVPSAAGVLSMMWVDRPWFGSPVTGGGPAFHMAWIAITLAVLQRWLAYQLGNNLSGRADMMLPGFGRLIGLWLAITVVVTVMGGHWWWGLAFGLLMPPLVSLGAINPWGYGWSIVLPVFAFAGLFLMGPAAWGMSLDGVQIETAGGFGLIMTAVWR